jgi:GTP-binding protein EngB required for normal cell division
MGEWHNGKMHGKGTLTFSPPDDGQYRGEFLDGLRHGKGTLERPFHSRPGRIVNDADGTYTGEWFKNMRHGQGTFTSVDGTKWTGTWCQNLKDGRFTKISPDGNVVEEKWRNGLLQGFRPHTLRESVGRIVSSAARTFFAMRARGTERASDEERCRDFMCPISGEIMTDPVIAKDGHTYERNNIVVWFRERLSSPLTNQNLTSAELTPNHTLKKVIADFLEAQKKRDESLAKVTSMERETAAMLSAERTRMQKKIDEEKAKVASMEMDMKRTRDRMFEREMETEREKLEVQEEQKRLFQDMEEERRRMEAKWEEKYRELTEQFARDRQEAEKKNTKLIEQMSTLHSSTANLKAERRSGIIVTNYKKKVQENRSEFLTCVQNLAKVKTPNLSIGLVGRTSSGKSSLLNRMFGTTCRVGATRCTSGVQEVWRFEDPDIHKGISVWDVFGFNDEEAYESIETINTFVSLHAVLLLYRDDIHSCKNTIELFRAADVKVIVVRSQIDTLTPEELQEIEQVEAPKAKEYGAYHWTKTTTKSGTSADDLKKYILSLPSARAGTEGEQGNNIETPETVRRHRNSACNSGNTSPLQMEPAHSFVAAGGQAAQEQADAALARALQKLDFQESTAQAQQPGMMDQQGMQQQMARPVCVKDPHQAMQESEFNMWLSQVPAFRDIYTERERERERESLS